MFSSSERGKAIGFMGTTYSFGAVVGMVLGGALMAWHPFGLTWQTVFLLYAFICLFVFLGAAFFMEESRVAQAPRLDLGGVGLLFVAMTSLVLPLIEGRGLGWPLWTVILLAVSPFVVAAFLWFEAQKTRKGEFPLVDLTLFSDKPFIVGLTIALTFYISFAFLFCLSIYLQAERHNSPLESGLILLPMAITFFLTSFISPYLLKLLKARILVIGFGFLALGLSGLCLAVQGAPDWAIEASLAVAGIGNGLTLSSLIKVVTSELEPRHAGLAAGALFSAMQIGAVLGYVLIGGIFFLTLGAHPDAPTYTRAFTSAVLCSLALLILDGFLAFKLVVRREKEASLPLGVGEPE
jgi:MFS family permease